MKMRLHQQQSGVVLAVPLPCGQHKVQKPYRSHLLSADQVFAAGFLANTSSLVNRTLMLALLGGAGTEHARLHTQFP